MNIITIEGLYKTYKARGAAPAKQALKGIDLNIPHGSIFGLLGPNGAGKSTLINILAGLAKKTSGKVVVDGFDLDKDALNVRRTIGVVPQEVVIDPFFPVRETLEFYAGYFGIRKKDRRTDEILDALKLSDKADAPPRSLSGGMKRRLLIAKALVHNPKILILDEPTAGVDVELRQQLWEYVRELNRKGTTILLTTHYLEEAQELCDSITVINKGEVIANDSTRNLMDKFGQKCISLSLNREITALPTGLDALGAELSDDRRSIKLHHNRETPHINEVISRIKNEGLEINDISTQETDLEDVFRLLVNGR